MHVNTKVFPKSRFVSLIAVIILCAFSGVAGASNVESKHPVTVDDVLRIEAIGAVEFSADGTWLAYNLLPPYEDISDFSYWMYAQGLSGHQLWIKNMEHKSPPKLQPGLDPTATNFFFGFSPSGDHVVTLEYSFGKLNFVACRVGRNKCARLDRMPDFRDRYIASARWNERIEWISDRKFVVPTRDDDLPGSELRNRAYIGQFLWRSWNRAWRGDGPTASEVVSTGRDRSQDWAAGALTEFDVGSGASRIIADGRYAGVRVSPDRKRVIAAQVGERFRPSADAKPVPTETHPTFDRRYALRVIDIETGAVKELADPFEIDPHSLSWSADGSRFLVFGWQRDEEPHEGAFYVVDARTLVPHRQKLDGFEIANSRFDPEYFIETGPARSMLLDEGLVVLARRDQKERFDWFLIRSNGVALNLSNGLEDVSGYPLYADGGSVSLLARHGAYRIDDQGHRTKLNRTDDLVIRDIAYQGNPSHSWANEFRYSREIYRRSFNESGTLISTSESNASDVSVEFTNFSSPPAVTETLALNIPGARVLAASREANAALVTSKVGSATKVTLVQKGANDVQLAILNEHLNRVADPDTLQISYPLSDPEDSAITRNMSTCLFLPPDFDQAKKYPLLFDIYPSGTPGECSTLGDAALIYQQSDLWAARGFIYVRPAIPLDYARTPAGPIAGMDEVVEQTLDAITELVPIDTDRVVLFGLSQGGVSSLYVSTQSDRFAAVISMNGWADFFSHYFGARGLLRYFHLDQNGGDNRWRYECLLAGAVNVCPFGFGTTALEASALYSESSPVALARGITAPVMLVHSDLDYFDIAQYDEMFGALYRAGKEARYVRYWGEGHIPSSPANIRDLWTRIDAFLVETGVLREQDEPHH
ncbi:alpha/beta hydrolase family protein [Henriciella aquimarina]|uniref:alpha/beta hydrolase family protein n=1 Tax=Henriciella aquimarina TaxID=545261 RepID=UPI000A0603D1|nr:prolyl oligopeptidase family serine peptidase [Henriciella aquimarina]